MTMTVDPDVILSWRDEAACHPSRIPPGVTAADFFAGSYAGTSGTGIRQKVPDWVKQARERAKAVCKVCPVAAECRKYALSLAIADRVGVWAGELHTPPSRGKT